MLVALSAKGNAHIWRAPSFDEIAVVEAAAGAEQNLPEKAANRADLWTEKPGK